MHDDNAEARARAQAAGRRTLAELEERQRQAAINPPPTTLKTAADLRKLAQDRHVAALMSESSRQSEEAERIRTSRLPSEGVNPYQHLSVPEIQELSRLEQLEESQKKELASQFTSLASWCLIHREVPANADAVVAISNWCRERGLSLAHQNLDSAWSALQQSGRLRPNYSKANSAQHDQNIEDLKAQGVQVYEVPNPLTATAAELDDWLRNQPPPTLANLLPKNESPDPGSMTPEDRAKFLAQTGDWRNDF
jgi:hypothetical protein